ncbi:MAG: DUF4249 domain-containing protein [Bacteroidota bacterium]
MWNRSVLFKRGFQVVLLGVVVVVLTACQEEFQPAQVEEPHPLVVEGYIEASGDLSSPPYVFLTRSFPFFNQISGEQFDAFFVHDADVRVSDGEREVRLIELCFADLSEDQIDLAENFLGRELDSLGINLCVYLDPTFTIIGEEGKTYDLTIEAEGELLTATTTIPEQVELDSVFFVEPPGEPRDTLAQLRVILDDPPEENFYRYFVSVDGGEFKRDDFSVFNDRLFNDERLEFPLNRPLGDDESFDLSTFGLFRRGTDMTLKFAFLDEAHHQFWETLEFASANQGPFSSYTRIATNINGGLGIWGGLACTYYDRAVPE